MRQAATTRASSPSAQELDLVLFDKPDRRRFRRFKTASAVAAGANQEALVDLPRLGDTQSGKGLLDQATDGIGKLGMRHGARARKDVGITKHPSARIGARIGVRWRSTQAAQLSRLAEPEHLKDRRFRVVRLPMLAQSRREAMNDDMEVRIQDLAIDEIRELLLEAGAEITHEQAGQLAAFIANAGGCDKALEILTQLASQRDAA